MTSLTGCMGGENLEKTTDTDTNEEIEEDEIIEPVGTDNLSSLEKRISELEDTIEEYENLEGQLSSLEKRISELEDKTEEYESLKDNLSNLEKTIGSGSSDPVIYFMEYEDADYRWTIYLSGGPCASQFNCTNLYEGDNFLFCYDLNILYPLTQPCLLTANAYDTDGFIEVISYETTTGNLSGSALLCNSNYWRVLPNNVIGCTKDQLGWINVCGLEPVNQTITVRAYDNDGNSSAEAEYYLDYDAACNASFGR